MSLTTLPAAAVALGLASAMLTIGAAVVANPDQADPAVTGTIGSGSGQADDYVNMFASGPGRGWFVQRRAPAAADTVTNRKIDR